MTVTVTVTVDTWYNSSKHGNEPHAGAVKLSYDRVRGAASFSSPPSLGPTVAQKLRDSDVPLGIEVTNL
jgi:hypothetical protein